MTDIKHKIAFIGGGNNSAVGYAHYCASHLDGAFELVAGAFSKNEDINHATANQYGVALSRIYSDWEQLISIEKDNIDAVVILTPTPLHFDMIKMCFEHKIPVICEKAITIDSNQCKALQDLQKQTGAFINVTYNYSGYPMVRELKSIIESNQLGKINHIQIEMPQEGFSRLLANGEKPTPQSWRLQDETIPTIYLDLAVHLHHLVHYTTGLKPIETIATQNSYGWFDNVIDDVSAIVNYESDVKVQYWFSKSALGHRNGLRIKVYGSEGAAEWIQSSPEFMTIERINGKKETFERGSDCLVAEEPRYNRFKAGHPSGFIEAFANVYSDFALSLQDFKNKNESRINQDYGLDISYQGLSLLESMVKSTESRTWVKIDE